MENTPKDPFVTKTYKTSDCFFDFSVNSLQPPGGTFASLAARPFFLLKWELQAPVARLHGT